MLRFCSSDVDRAADMLSASATVVLQMQQPGSAMLRAARLARHAGRRVILDGAPAQSCRAELLACADVLRADTHEAELLCEHEITGADDALRAARELRRRGPAVVMVGALSDGDVLVADDGEAVYPYGGEQAVDSTGAGDALVAALAVRLTEGADPQTAGRWAAAAAAIAVKHVGGRPQLTRAALDAKTAE